MYEPPIRMIEEEATTKIIEEVSKEHERVLWARLEQKIDFAVDKNELIKALQYDRAQYEKGYVDGLAEPRWIPCSERLPEKDGDRYLITSYCKSTNSKRINMSEWLVNKYGYGFWSYVPSFGYEVIAWMPLPAPYESEGE